MPNYPAGVRPTTAPKEFPVAEVFGPTVQGEGQMIGRRAWFVRTAGCDSRCPWCDTQYAQTVDAGTVMTAREVVDRLRELGASWEIDSPRPTVVLTGGNPCVHDLGELCRRIRQELHGDVVVETQGTALPQWTDWISHLVLSPKRHLMSHSCSWEHLFNFTRAVLSHETKVVVFDDEDYAFARAANERLPGPMTIQIGSVDGEPQRMAYWLERFATDLTWAHSDVRILPQLHVLAWGNERGR